MNISHKHFRCSIFPKYATELNQKTSDCSSHISIAT